MAAAHTAATGSTASKAAAYRTAQATQPAAQGPAARDPGAARLSALQRSLGNRGFRDLLAAGREDPGAEALRERAADRLAERTMAMPGAPADPPGGPRAPAARAPAAPLFSSGGDPLPPEVRRFYEPRFGQDLGDVRVHTGPVAERHARALRARAFTDGNHIWMGRNQGVQPSLLLAHELAHVVEARTAARPVIARKEADDDPDAKVSLGILDNPVFSAAAEQAIGSTQWTVMRELLRGVQGGLQSVPPEQQARIDAKLAKLGFGDGIDYAEGYGLGILEGLWLGLKGLGEAVVTLVKLPYEISRYLYEKVPDLAAKYGPRLAMFLLEGDGIGARLQNVMAELLKHPLEAAQALASFVDALGGMARAKIHELGRGIAGKLLTLIEEPWFDYGRDLGKVVGQVLFEVILAVASEGIANVVKQGLSLAARLTARVVEGAVEIFRGLRRVVGSVVEWIGKLIGRMTGKLAEMFAELKAMMSRLGAMLEELAGERQLLGDTGTGFDMPIPEPKGPTIMEARAAKPTGGGGRAAAPKELPSSRPPRRREGLTGPSEKPSVAHEPTGRRTQIPAGSDEATARALRLENTSADDLAKAGYKVEQNPRVPGDKAPDLRVEGKIFDVYAPQYQTSAKNVFQAVVDKATAGQATRVVVNLDESGVTAVKLAEEFSRRRAEASALEEVLITRKGFVKRVFP